MTYKNQELQSRKHMGASLSTVPRIVKFLLGTHLGPNAPGKDVLRYLRAYRALNGNLDRDTVPTGPFPRTRTLILGALAAEIMFGGGHRREHFEKAMDNPEEKFTPLLLLLYPFLGALSRDSVTATAGQLAVRELIPITQRIAL
ncbi:hypothetical protein H2199_003416 [Coniosporium tulheliwenetii]|uniref:Uncharacterized protein n=1 Tax=Coniosporium tulheliwenetii TaxID=3383036 RepID=A0ACC2ZB27_9PEZI|nr:hypothetical protein H2199_003416 [Cladosporium sp. JES 115]